LFKNQIISGDYSKTSFLMRSAALFTEIMHRTSTRQRLLFRRYKCKLTRSVNAENAVRQASRANASEGEDHNFFQIINSNPNTIISFRQSIQTLIRNKYYGGLRLVAYELFFLNLFIHFILNITFYFTLLFKYYYIQIGQIIYFFFINCGWVCIFF